MGWRKGVDRTYEERHDAGAGPETAGLRRNTYN